MINIILFGPPGSGKGTQASKLVEKYKLLHISTGDLFRYELGNNTELGKLARSFMDRGELVPDEVTIAMLKKKVIENQDGNGFIFDGFPRTIAQAEALNNLMVELDMQINGLVALEVSEDEIVKRLLLRGQTSGRSDDQDEQIIRNRFGVYLENTSLVYNYYQQFGKSQSVNGIGGIEEIFDRLCHTIDNLHYESSTEEE